MKASIKFREEQKPLLRAKIPINIMGLPFQSGVVAGGSKEASLNLGTLFESGPAFKFSYRPNDTHNPFSFICKIGIGLFGSPNKSPLTMSAAFNPIGTHSPGFFIHFKPNFGDFSFRRSHSSILDVKPNVVVFPVENWYGKGNGNGTFLQAVESGITGLLKGNEISATTVVPVRDFAVVNCRWGLRVPPAEVAADDGDTVIVGTKGDRRSGFALPHLVLSKIGAEYVSKSETKGEKRDDDVVGACLDVKKQLELMQEENGLLRKALDDFRSEIAVGKMNNIFPIEGEKNVKNKYEVNDKRSFEEFEEPLLKK